MLEKEEVNIGNKKNILKKVFSEKKLKIYNIIIILLAILVFEFGYCNHTFTERILKGEVTEFYFSLCRGVFYLAVIIATLIINKRFDFKQIEETFENKTKKIVFLIYIIFAIGILGKIFLNAIISEETTLYLPQLAMLLLALIGFGLSAIYLSKNYTANIVALLILSSVLSVTCTTYNVLDEKKHFMESYNMSYGNLDFNNPKTDKQFMEEIRRGTHYTQMADYYKVPYEFEQGQIPEDDVPDSTPAAYNPIVYIPSTIGITIATILQGSVADVFLMGRIVNLLVYAILIIITLKILPFKKNVFFIIALTPMIVCLAGTYSPDGIGMAFVSLFIAYCLRLYNKKDKISVKEVICLSILYCLLLSFKSMAFVGIGLLIFILPIMKIIRDNNKKIALVIPVAIISLLFVLLLQPKIDIAQGDPRGGNTGAAGQIESLKNNPVLLLEVGYNHLTQSLLNFDWLRDLNFRYYFSDISSVIFLCMLIFYLYVAIKDDSVNFSKKNKVIFIGTFFIIYGMTSAILYLTFTPIGSKVLLGYQARYIFPIVFLVLMCVSNKNLKNLDSKESELVKIAFVSNLFIVLSAMGAIFKW